MSMKRIRVEFRYFDRSTCSRCKATNEHVKKTVRALRRALRESGFDVEFKNTKLPASELAQSNSIFINGKDIEEIVNGKKKARSTTCKGCSELINGPCDCRAYEYRGRKYRFIPIAMIREAIRKTIARKSLN